MNSLSASGLGLSGASPSYVTGGFLFEDGMRPRVLEAIRQCVAGIGASSSSPLINPLIGRVAVVIYDGIEFVGFIVGAYVLAAIASVVAMQVFTCAVSLAVSLIATPLLATRRLVALNYTLFHYHPSSFMSSALKANLLFWKGHIYDWFLWMQASDFNLLLGSGPRQTRFHQMAERAYAQMLVETLPENFVPGTAKSVWRDALVERLAQGGVQFPPNRSLSFDLVKWNNSGEVLRAIQSERIEIPQDLGNEPRVEFRPEVTDRKYASKQVRKDYFQNKVPCIEVPPLPHDVELADLSARLWSFVDRTWSLEERINDDNRWLTKNELIAHIHNCLVRFDSAAPMDYQDVTRETLQTVKNALGHVFLKFLERKVEADAIGDRHQKEKTLAAWSFDARSFFKSLGISLTHCWDRKLDDAYIYYVKYVQRKPISSDDINAIALETRLSQLLQEFRQDTVRHICSNLIDTNRHQVDTERFILASLNGELGLGLPQAFSARDALTQYAMREKLPEAREFFYKLYTPQSITRHLIAEIKKAAATQDKQRNLYTKIVEWFASQAPIRQAADVFDIEKNEFHEEAMITLLEKMRVIQ
jgi:type IV secretory pathway VirB3-like protein